MSTQGNSDAQDPQPDGASNQSGPPGRPEDAAAGQSRRNFLKAAVISSAGVAAAGSVAAGVAFSNRQAGPLIRFADSVTNFSPNDPCAICTTLTQAPYDPQSTFNTSESIMLWLRFKNVPAGTYTVNIGDGVACSVTFPLQYQNGSSAVEAWTHAAGSLACSPTSDPAGDAAYTALTITPNSGAANHNGSLPVSFTLGTTLDVLFRVHVKACSVGTFTLTTTLNNAAGALVDTCHNEITIVEQGGGPK
jgi:hypothetical protein